VRAIFVDTNYWVAVANPLDPLAPVARSLEPLITGADLVTTQEVLAEFLGFVSGLGEMLRYRAVSICNAASSNPNILVLPQTARSFQRGLDLYAARLDKGYSLVDCISMVTMRSRGIGECLTADRHFAQEGFAALMGA